MNCGDRSVVQWDPTRKAIVLTGGLNHHDTLARGLVPTLSCLFYGDYTYPRSVSIITPKAARSCGRMLDHSVAQLVRKPPPQMRGGRNAQLSKIFQQRVKGVLSEHGWEALACQFPVGSSILRIGTKIDLLCECSEGLVVVEWKLGFDTYWRLADSVATLKAPYEALPNCPLSHHKLQAAFSAYLLNQTQHPWQHIPIVRIVVIRLSHDATVKPEIEDVSLDLVSSLALARLEQTIHQNRRQRLQSIAYQRRKRRRQKDGAPPAKRRKITAVITG